MLVLERGERRPHAWHVDHQDALERESVATVHNATPAKRWRFSLTFGGCSSCWWACVPRMLPADFETRSRYGYGRDWPLDYDELEPFYAEVEERMSVAGPDRSPFRRSGPYPQPAHRLSRPEEALRAAMPDRFFPLPVARPTRPTPGGRAPCCANHVCHRCPIDAKFSVQNEMADAYADPRVELRLGAQVLAVALRGDVAEGLRFRAAGRESVAQGELVGLGTNALFNAHLLLRSGLDDPWLGRGLMEQTSVSMQVWLDGMDGLQGSTSTTGHGYMLYDGAHRREHAAVLLETTNEPVLRPGRGRWRQLLRAKLIVEDLPQRANRVSIDPEAPERPRVQFEGHSPETLEAIRRLPERIPPFLASLPVEDLHIGRRPGRTEAHILGTTVMGRDPADSVVDPLGVHHRVRNLVVLGGSTFPTAAPANPTLTLSALSLRAARRLVGRPVA